MQHAVDELAVGGKAGIVPIVDMIAGMTLRP